MSRNAIIFLLLLLAAIAGFLLIREIENPSVSSSLNETNSSHIMTTNGVLHTVPLEEIISGGPEDDAITPILSPQFISIAEAEETLLDTDQGLSYEYKGITKFYPLEILTWHQVVNDTIDDRHILITFSPLSNSGVIFNSQITDETLTFGTSGKIWNSNLIMYDKSSKSLWSQVLGEAIMGSQAGTYLDVLPSVRMAFGSWKQSHPEGIVLAREAGLGSNYDTNPFESYYTNDTIFFQVTNNDTCLQKKDFIIGIKSNGSTKAYLRSIIKERGEIIDTFEGQTFVLTYNKDADTVTVYRKTDDNTLTQIGAAEIFWFVWAAAYPNTELYQ